MPRWNLSWFTTVGWDGWMRIRAAWGHDGKRARKFQFKIRKTKQRTVKYMTISFDAVRNSLVISFAEG